MTIKRIEKANRKNVVIITKVVKCSTRHLIGMNPELIYYTGGHGHSIDLHKYDVELIDDNWYLN